MLKVHVNRSAIMYNEFRLMKTGACKHIAADIHCLYLECSVVNT